MASFDWGSFAGSMLSGSGSKDDDKVHSEQVNYGYKGMHDYLGKNNDVSIGSDEHMKDLAGRLDLTDQFANINSYLYKYKPEAQEVYQGEAHVDGKPHVGILAQELEQNPITESTVKENPNTGYKEVDSAQLCLTLAAVVSDMAKEIKELKQKIGV